METIKNLLFYFFNPAPGQDFQYYIPISILVFILIGGSIIFARIYKKKRKNDFAFKRVFKKTSKRLFLIGLLFLILALLRYENIPYFSMRFWLYLSSLLLAFFIYKTIKCYKKEYPKEKESIKINLSSKVKKSENNYLPNKKKK